MEICRCREYREAVENFKFFLPGTLHLLHNKEPVPANCCLKWHKTKISHMEPHFIKPGVWCYVDADEKVELTDDKWIPVSPDLISQRMVNQYKLPNMLLG